METHASGRTILSSIPGGPSSLLPMLAPLHEVNERCVETLVQSAKREHRDTLPLVLQLRQEFREVTPEIRTRVAARSFLLVDMQFTNKEWWLRARDRPSRPQPLPAWRGTLPRSGGARLARATLLLAWSTIRLDPNVGCLLGMTREVVQVVGQLSTVELLEIAESHFRHVRPRWEDRPAVWRQLLKVAQGDDLRRLRDINLYGLQLLTGECLSPSIR